MIELPAGVYLNSAEPALVDRGGVMRGASALRVNRKGSHYRIACSLPPLLPGIARVVVRRLITAKRLGLRVEFPLMHGQPLGIASMNGAGQAGRSLVLRGLTAGAAINEGFWLSIVDPTGQHYLHVVTADYVASQTGTATITIEPELRFPFMDGALVHLGTPKIEGLVDGDEFAWSYSLAHHTSLAFTIEEAR